MRARERKPKRGGGGGARPLSSMSAPPPLFGCLARTLVNDEQIPNLAPKIQRQTNKSKQKIKNNLKANQTLQTIKKLPQNKNYAKIHKIPLEKNSL